MTDDNSKKYRRTVSHDVPNVRENPMYESDGRTGDGHTGDASVIRQCSEPASNRLSTIKSNIVKRTKSLKSIVAQNTAEFFGLSEDNNKDYNLWEKRRERLIERKCGKLRDKTQSRNAMRMVERQVSGFDVVDGAESYAKSVRISESVSRVPDDDVVMGQVSRPPVARMTLNGIVYLTSKVKKRFSQSHADRELSTEVKKIEVTDILPSVAVPATPDSVFGHTYYDFASDDEDDDFFGNPYKDQMFDANHVQRNRTESFDEVEGMQLRSGAVTGTAISARPMQTHPRWVMSQKSYERKKMIPIDFSEYDYFPDRREYGMGIVGRLFHRRFRPDLSKEERKAIDHFDDHRPYFTYWITTVQILIFIVSLCVYGFAPFGFGFSHVVGRVKVPSLTLQQVAYYEPENFWIGLRAADLIHLGAKFTPCMRKDDEEIQKIKEDLQAKERETGCCIRNDGSGCIQTLRESCSPLLSTWVKWSIMGDSFKDEIAKIGTSHRISGPVCGQDPRYCQQPASTEPYEWPDDVTKWPKCRKKTNMGNNYLKHYSCELIGRPCCIGIYGQCIITTQEYCEFNKGFFHEEATLCSQVSCMKNTCGMIPFYTKNVPNQFYRIFTPIFIHAGIIHLIFSVLIQFFVMRDLERATGSLRMAVIYLFSGMGGYLVSAMFVPFRAEVGPSGSHFGLLACLFIELYRSWDVIEQPLKGLLKLSIVPVLLFAIGFLPWVDNYAHIFGFIIGLLLSIALMPYLMFRHNKRYRIIQIIICLSIVLFMFILFFVIFYQFPSLFQNCEFCKILNCIPFTNDFCRNQRIDLRPIDLI